MKQLWGAPCCGFTASKNTSRQCHYFAFQPATLSATASPFTAFPLQIHRSLRKVKKAGSVYFGRWNIFWKSNKSAIFSFWWLREQREPRPASANSWTKGGRDGAPHERGDTGDTNHMARSSASTDSSSNRLQINDNVAQIKVSAPNLWSPCVRMLLIIDLLFILSLKGVQPILTSHQTVTESGLTSLSPAHSSTQRGARPGRFTAERGSSSWLCRTRGKVILFTFNLPFPLLWNLERAKSCNTCIKNKCSRNGPTGSKQREAFVAWPRGPVAKSNRYAQYSSTYSQITITHI